MVQGIGLLATGFPVYRNRVHRHLHHRDSFMTKHTGYDHRSEYRFRIAAFNTETHTVAIQYAETVWSPGDTLTNRLPWTEFLEQLMQGHFEIRPADEQRG
jgi:hypothetical protein